MYFGRCLQSVIHSIVTFRIQAGACVSMLSLSRDSSALPEKAVGDTQAIFLRHYLFSTPKKSIDYKCVCVCGDDPGNIFRLQQSVCMYESIKRYKPIAHYLPPANKNRNCPNIHRQAHMQQSTLAAIFRARVRLPHSTEVEYAPNAVCSEINFCQMTPDP